ncbi:MAG: RagB/SusD family nutrient uptake outer membrane protein [Bacteroidales bacterium]|nr:MAG: RagB/SusD family nutrient uptake outer membrane protein [Bacteroidales bacterium]
MIRKYIILKKAVRCLLFLLLIISVSSCSDYLDVVPDNVSTVDHAFKLRNEAEKYLFTCYSYLPKDGNVAHNIGMLSGDEIWIPFEKGYTSYSFNIARGKQRISDTYVNAWDGYWHGAGPDDNYPIFDGIRHCNTFLENVNDKTKVLDLEDDERERWLGEVEFLKAYYHFYLLRMYGPIPIIDKNLSVDAPEGEVNVSRMPIDTCINYISNLLDSAASKLPDLITDRITELGRISKPIALAVKAKVLLTAASPFFNGNSDYNNFVSRDGELFFNPTYDETKWQKAADAALEAIQAAETAGNNLYEFTNKTFNLSDTTITQMSIRQAVCERWNSEIIWSNPNSTTNILQQLCMVPLSLEDNHNYARKIMSPPLKIARMFYTKNGVPIDEDKTLNFSNNTELRIAVASERFNIKEGYETARLNFDREPRFYADLSFDGGIWYKYDSPSNSDEGTYVVKAKYGDYAGSSHSMNYNETGYYIKKLVDWNMTMSSSGATYKDYPWPEIRLADLYLMYAEALNETSGPASDVLIYLDRIRDRAGLKGVAESWTNYSTNPSKYQSKDGLREIIQRERLIELAFEGSRFWDLRRWKQSSEYLNEPITGWNVYGTDSESYYQVRTVYQQEFISPRDYLWPIEDSELLRNTKLVQNPGW